MRQQIVRCRNPLLGGTSKDCLPIWDSQLTKGITLAVILCESVIIGIGETLENLLIIQCLAGIAQNCEATCFRQTFEHCKDQLCTATDQILNFIDYDVFIICKHIFFLLKNVCGFFNALIIVIFFQQKMSGKEFLMIILHPCEHICAERVKSTNIDILPLVANTTGFSSIGQSVSYNLYGGA